MKRKQATKKVLSRLYPAGVRYTKNNMPKSGFCWYYDNTIIYMKAHWSRSRKKIDKVHTNRGDTPNNVPNFEDFAWVKHAIQRLWERSITKEQAYEAIKYGIELDDSSPYDKNRTKRTKYLWNNLNVTVEYSSKRPLVIQQHYFCKYTDEYFIDELPKLQARLTKSDPGCAVIIGCTEDSRLKERISDDAEMHKVKDLILAFTQKGQSQGLTTGEQMELDIFEMLWQEEYGVQNEWWLAPLEAIPLHYRRWD